MLVDGQSCGFWLGWLFGESGPSCVSLRVWLWVCTPPHINGNNTDTMGQESSLGFLGFQSCLFWIWHKSWILNVRMWMHFLLYFRRRFWWSPWRAWLVCCWWPVPCSPCSTAGCGARPSPNADPPNTGVAQKRPKCETKTQTCRAKKVRDPETQVKNANSQNIGQAKLQNRPWS